MSFTNDEMRVLTAFAPLILRQLEQRQQRVLDEMYGQFKQGNTKLVAHMAQYACVREQITEINNALRMEGVKHELATRSTTSNA